MERMGGLLSTHLFVVCEQINVLTPHVLLG